MITKRPVQIEDVKEDDEETKTKTVHETRLSSKVGIDVSELQEEKKNSETTAVFKGYFDDDEEDFNLEKRAAPVAKRDHYPVFYSGPNQGEYGAAEAKLVFVGNMTTGGFKVHNDAIDFFRIEW